MKAIDLAGHVAETMLTLFPEHRNTCIDSTRILVRACELAGISARPQAVDVRVFNLEAWTLHGMGVPVSDWPPSAYSVGTGPGQFLPGGWDGHLVAVLREEDGRHLVDASASQFERPGKIEVAEVIGMAIGGLWTPQDPLYRIFQNRTVIEYRPMAPGDPRQSAWRESDAWTHAPKWYEEAAQHVLLRAQEAE